ncbi:LXG domain-containing protein [Ruficoccus sp. ZRK36]|uniref:LXG domain-containing protein n=1 Tax=Ruficoccus sp. ZRK36 TaxID=2866311 RepID=UPI001C73BDC8|nr:LXG domain-containing protein [Ruficoccus sp. ZRK36]QYY34750.1 LXG domain-containing protein [Ruficoccus sp. ZRK36]
MDDSLLPSTPQIIDNIEEELCLNQEVSQMKSSVQEMKQRMSQLEESFTLTERVGFSSQTSEPKRREIEMIVTAINGQINIIKDRAKRWKELRQQTERLLERFLSDHDVPYRTGAHIKVFYRDLRRSLDEFNTAIREFIKDLGQARAAMCAQYDAQNRAFHANAHERFEEAAASGLRVDRAIRHFNQLADGHTDEIRQTYLSGITLPRLTILQARQSVQNLREQDIASAHRHIDYAIERLEKFIATEMPALATGIQQADSEHDETTTRYVEQYWEQLRHQIWVDMQQGISHKSRPEHQGSKLRLRWRPEPRDDDRHPPAALYLG